MPLEIHLFPDVGSENICEVTSFANFSVSISGESECPTYLAGLGAKQDITPFPSLKLEPHQHELPWIAVDGCGNSDKFVNVSPTSRSLLADIQDNRLDSDVFSSEIGEECRRQEKILQFLMSASSGGLDLSLLFDLMGIQALQSAMDQHIHAPLICPNGQHNEPGSLVDFVEDMAHSSKITFHPNGQVLLAGSGTEIKDILSIVTEFYVSKSSTTYGNRSILVPHISRLDTVETQASLKVKDMITAPLKSPEKIKIKPSPKKRNSRKRGAERDLYRRNNFHACENLLSLIMGRNQHGKAAILSLKRSGPELPELLTQFSVGIAGTGLAVLFSVICKVASGRVPFCASKILSTSFGLGLVWLSHAVNGLQNAIARVGRNASKTSLKDEEIMSSVDINLKEIYFRAAIVMGIAVLRLA